MADEPKADPPPDDATRVKSAVSDDATVVRPSAEATVIAAREAPPDGGDRPGPDEGATSGAGEDDFTVMSSADAHGSTPAEPGSTGDRTVVGSAAEDDLTVAHSQGGAADAGGGMQQAAADARTQAVSQSRGAAGTVGNTYTLGGATVASGGVSAAASPPVTRAVLLGIVTGLALFGATALWLLRGH